MSKTQNIKDFEAEKEKINSMKKRSRTNSVRLVSVLIFICIVFISLYFLGGTDNVLNNFDGDNENGIDSAVVGSEGFPLSFVSNDIITAKSFSSRLFVLTEKLLISVKSGGEIGFTKAFTFVKPELTVSEKYGLVYDRASPKFLLFNSKGTVYEGTTDGERHIITATVDNKGNCAIVTKSDNSACRVQLIDKSGEIIYIWSCAEEYVVSLDISTDGKELLCGSIGAYNGDIYTKLYKLDVSENTEEHYNILGSGCVDVSFYGKDKALVTCLDKRVIMDLRTEDGSPTQAEYSGDALFIANDFNGYCAVVTDDISSFDTDEVTLYDKNNSVIFKSEVPQGVIDVFVSGKNVYCLTGDSVLYLNSSGEIKKTVPTETKGDGIVIQSSKAYYYTAGSLREGF